MPRGVALLSTAALLAGPAVVGFSSGGATRRLAPVGCRAAFVILALAVAVVPGAPWPETAAGRWALAGLAGFAAWTLLARTWAPSHGRADDAFELAALYLATVAAASLLLRRRAVARLAEPALALGAVAVIGYGVAGRLVPGLLELAVDPARRRSARPAADLLERDGRARRPRPRARHAAGGRRDATGMDARRRPPPRCRARRRAVPELLARGDRGHDRGRPRSSSR